MKDLYKILGVKENASEEEIRERWIELTKQYHPDLAEGMDSDERIREINEAYQVLKHSSTRVEYDLTRAYGHEKRESKKVPYLKKFGVPAGILIIFIILGATYLYRVQSSPSSQHIVLRKTEEIDRENKKHEVSPKNQGSEINQINQINQRDKRNEMNQKDQTDQIKQTENLAIRRDEPGQRPLAAAISKPIDVRTKQARVDAATPAAPVKSKQTSQPPSPVAAKIAVQTDSTNTADLATQQLKDVKTPTSQLPNDPIGPATQQVQRLDDVRTPIAKLPDALVTSRSAVAADLIKPIDAKLDLNALTPPSLLATEDEVKKFFIGYVKHYNRMDKEGFLPLFSSKAVQNQKEGLEGIRKTYTDFFTQGQEVRYHTQDMKIEIYQNSVEVNARYEIEQIIKKSGERRIWRGPIRWVLIKEDGTLRILSIDYKYEKIPEEGGVK